ncbi:MAG: hypothetical protein ACRDHO_06580 [Actinomycetota bacterium]
MEREERTGKQTRPGRTLAVRVTLLAVTVGAVVAATAAMAGADGCAAPNVGAIGSSSPGDVVCFHLVRTLAERVGIATGLVTAILTLTVIGLSRLVTEQGQSQIPDRTR